MKYTFYELLKKFKIEIPIIQRDYAQGRDSAIELRIMFLNRIKETLNSDSGHLNLDFIFGYTKNDDEGNLLFVPLDGQQRLTTLWLIHWYVAFKHRKSDTNNGCQIDKDVLKRFTYQTRVTSQRFCEKLVSEPIPETGIIGPFSEKIKDTYWFMASWNYDPTILSMLNMLDSIDGIISDCQNVCEKLVSNEKITFDYIDIRSDKFKLTDELYIKMNSRGKPLTSFEVFKAQFSDLLSSKKLDFNHANLTIKNISVTFQEYFIFKIDNVWIDLFWAYRKKYDLEGLDPDRCIMNFIYFIAEVLYYKNNTQKIAIPFENNFDFLTKVFSSKENVLFLYYALDLLYDIEETEDIEHFFDILFSKYKSTHNSVVIFEDKTTDLFLRASTGINFEVKHKLLFYSLLLYCIKIHIVSPDMRLKHFMRIIRNLLLAVRQPNQKKKIEYASNLRLRNIADYAKFIDAFVDSISENPIKDIYVILAESNLEGFTKDIIKAEKAKAGLLINNPNMSDSIYQLEDHLEIQGNISCFNLDCDNAIDKINAFCEIWDKGIESSLIIRALLTFGDYSIITHKYTSLGETRYFGCNNYWNRILTTLSKGETARVSNILDKFLIAYLNSKGANTENKLEFLVDKYLCDNSKTNINKWRYYFIKYEDIVSNSHDRFNLFTWNDENGFDINNLGNSGRNPLLSHHINPYIYTLSEKFSQFKEISPNWGRYSGELSSLSIEDRVDIFSKSEGWQIDFKNGFSISDALINKYEIENKTDYIILKDKDGKDRIEIVCDFIKELI
jgi:hypothetical protein